MLAQGRILTLTTIISAVVVATIVWRPFRSEPISPAQARARVGLPVRAVIVDARPAQPVENLVQHDERRWGRAEVNAGLERFPPIRSDWSDSPAL